MPMIDVVIGMRVPLSGCSESSVQRQGGEGGTAKRDERGRAEGVIDRKDELGHDERGF